MARLGARMMEPSLQEALRQGDNSLFVQEVRALCDDTDFISQALPEANEEQLAELRRQLADGSMLDPACRLYRRVRVLDPVASTRRLHSPNLLQTGGKKLWQLPG